MLYDYMMSKSKNLACLKVNYDECLLCHRRLGHANMYPIDKISEHEIVERLPKYNFMMDNVYNAYVKGK